MSIANELSSDVATAVLAHDKHDEAEPPRDSRDLVEVVMGVHSTLRRLTAESRKASRRLRESSEAEPLHDVASRG